MLVYRFAQLTTLFGFLAILVGATVNPTGSNMACEDWLPFPTCNGEVLPALTGGVLYEYGHRVVTWSTGLLTVVLAFLLWRKRRENRAHWWLGLSAALLVALQGGLGGLTVKLGISKPISILHLTMAMVYFCVMVVLTFRLRPPDRPRLPSPASVGLKRLVGIATLALFVQIVLGAVVRHTGAALQCMDIPLCQGRVWPEGALAQVHMVHRFGAVIAGLLLVAAGIWVAVKARGLRWLGVFIVLGVAAQIVLGIYSVLTFKSVPVVIAHLAVGALLLAVTLRTYLGLSTTATTPAEVAGQLREVPAS